MENNVQKKNKTYNYCTRHCKIENLVKFFIIYFFLMTPKTLHLPSAYFFIFSQRLMHLVIHD